MSTQAQIDANRNNARSSTGPKSDEGKLRSSQNALALGLGSQTALLPTEDPSAYAKFCDEFNASLKPQGILEIQLVKTLADAHWRLNRCRDLIHNPESDPATLDRFYIYEQRLLRTANTSLKQLRQIQEERRDTERLEHNKSIHIIEACRREKKPFDAAQFGFVCSTQELELAYDRYIAFETARAPRYWDSAPSTPAKKAA